MKTHVLKKLLDILLLEFIILIDIFMNTTCSATKKSVNDEKREGGPGDRRSLLALSLNCILFLLLLIPRQPIAERNATTVGFGFLPILFCKKRKFEKKLLFRVRLYSFHFYIFNFREVKGVPRRLFNKQWK